ncbi:phosphoethanolamine--lipid A transferase [Vibrio coralliilyticus]|uniref:phosphoethanolamine transferase n=1 Tax=Vibrio coralliilyticus TaxID=190893 RepID=UPI00345E5A4A
MNGLNTDRSKGISYAIFTALLALYFAVVVNLPFYKELHTIYNHTETVNLGFLLSIPLFLWASLNFLFSLFSWPYLTKPFFIVLLVCSSIVSYAGYNYGVLFDLSMMANLFETNQSEALSYLSVYSVGWVVVMGGLPALAVVKIRFKTPHPLGLIQSKLLSMVISILVVTAVVGLYYQNYVSVGRNHHTLNRALIPTEFVSSLSRYIKRHYFATPVKYHQLGLDAQQSAEALEAAESKPTLVVFMVGETARAQNYQLNGYNRETNSYTRDMGVISFQDVSSCGTATAVSVPCMFSNMDRYHFDRQLADNQDNVLDILKRAGVDVLWRDNDGGDKQVAKNVAKEEIAHAPTDPQCNGSTCYDMALLENFEQHVDSLKGNRLMVMHLIGSHGPTYFQRYPKDRAMYFPDCERSDIENCTSEQIINSYDNSILYTDYVVSQTIGKLKALQKQFNTALIYVSDHGESLGEEGIYLHGLPYSLAPKFQKRVPFLLWMSPGFKQVKHINTRCLQQEAQQTGVHSHDNVFHSLLGVMDVATQEYQSKLDIFSACRVENN